MARKVGVCSGCLRLFDMGKHKGCQNPSCNGSEQNGYYAGYPTFTWDEYRCAAMPKKPDMRKTYEHRGWPLGPIPKGYKCACEFEMEREYEERNARDPFRWCNHCETAILKQDKCPHCGASVFDLFPWNVVCKQTGWPETPVVGNVYTH